MSSVIPLRTTEPERPDKRFAAVRARASRIGASVNRVEDDRACEVFVVSRNSLTREIRDLAAVEGWLDRIEGCSL